jgi:hypothetical protein
MINFDYDLDEIVQLDGVGLVTLRKALMHMPDRIGPQGVLYRAQGKVPALFDAGQIQALLDRHKAELEAGNPPVTAKPTKMISNPSAPRKGMDF